MKSDMIAEIVSALGGVPRHVVLKMVMRKLLKTLKLLDLVVRIDLIMWRDLLELGMVSLLNLDLN